MFFKGSRYEGVDSNRITDKSGREIPYKRVRFVPKTDANATRTIIQGDRLDNLANYYYHDPERFWRICDANLALWPDDLVAEPGRKILIPPNED